MESTFFDINQLPQEEGLLVFGISMNRIGNIQSAENCFIHMKDLAEKITKTEGVGLVTVYSDYLYFHSEQPAHVLRDRYKELMVAHKDGFMNLVKKNPVWIPKAFSFMTFGQLLLDNSKEFKVGFDKIFELYNQDKDFQRYVHEDIKKSEHGFGEKEVSFILEEITFFYLATKGALSFNNQFVHQTEKWILNAYPGEPLRSEIYLYKKNPLKLSNEKNKYENSYYDLQAKIVYDLTKFVLD
jgi:hypothetical protein